VKKIRINLRRGIKTWTFVLYDSAESAFYLKEELPEVDDEHCKIVRFESGDVAEVEWLGSEWVYEDEMTQDATEKTRLRLDHEKYDKVRIGKMSKSKTRSNDQKTDYVELYSGWIPSGVIPWSEVDQKPIRVIPIKGKIQSKLDFSKLFSEETVEDLVDDLPEKSGILS
jgi:hypothetical protein